MGVSNLGARAFDLTNLNEVLLSEDLTNLSEVLLSDLSEDLTNLTKFY